MDREKIKAHITELKIKHSVIENEINDLTKHHGSDSDITQLKKMKLMLKEEISNFENQL
jgi:hypothetical protein